MKKRKKTPLRDAYSPTAKPDFVVGDVIRLRPDNQFYPAWSAKFTDGPFLIIDDGPPWRTKRLSDGDIMEVGVPTTWWCLRDEFMDAAYKANHDPR